MAGVSIEELGLRFVRVCAEEYWGSCLFPILFLCGILWSLFYHKKQTARIFLCYALSLALTVYNPLFVKYVIPKMNFEDEYYRFFWILPVIPGIAYYAVRIICSRKKNSRENSGRITDGRNYCMFRNTYAGNCPKFYCCGKSL